MTPRIAPGESPTEFGYGHLLAILLRRRSWFLSVFLVVLSITIGKTLTTEPTYQSTMQLLVEPNYLEKDALAIGPTPSRPSRQEAEIDYATQLNLMRSRQFFDQAAKMLQTDYPEISALDIESNLELYQVIEDDTSTRIFEGSYLSNDPLKTQKVLEAIQKVYQDYNLKQENLRLTEGLALINRELPVARERLVKAEKELEKFREGQNLVDPEQGAKSVADALSSIERERRSVRVMYEHTQAFYNSLQQKIASTPQQAIMTSRLSQASRYQSLLNELQQTELALSEERLRFTDQNPNVQKLLEQRQGQIDLIRGEVERVLGQVPPQLDFTGEGLLRQGQLGELDLAMSGTLVETEAELVNLQAREQSLAKAEQELRTKLATFPRLIAEYNRLQPEVEIQRETIKQLLSRRQELILELAQGGFKWQVVESPQPGEQIAPVVPQNILLGTVVGIFLGGVAAFISEAMDDSVHSADDLKQKIDLPLLGVIPQFPQIKIHGSLLSSPFRKPQIIEPSLMKMMEWQPLRESLDLIYKNIQLLNSAPNLKSLAVTSALTGEGRSMLSLGLALSAARVNQKVLLIDANLRHPTLHKHLNLPNEQGFSTLLSNDTALPCADHSCPMPHVWLSTFFADDNGVSNLGSNVDILTAGPIPSDSVKLLSSQRMEELMVAFEEHYDLVILDTSPILGTVDAMQAASFCSGVVMLGRLDEITESELNQAIAMLDKLNVIGLVANGGGEVKKTYLPSRNISTDFQRSVHQSFPKQLV